MSTAKEFGFRSDSTIGGTNQVALLRSELREGNGTSPTNSQLVADLHQKLLFYCDHLARSVAHRIYVSGDDLAQETWRKSLEYLVNPSGDRIKGDTHFERFLRFTAKRLLLDQIDLTRKHPVAELDAPFPESGTSGNTGEGKKSLGDQLADPKPTAEEWLIPPDNRYLHLVEMLFRAPHRFHVFSRQSNQRHPRQYQALVLYQLGTHLLNAYEGEGDDEVYFIRSFVELFSIRLPRWLEIEMAVETVHREGLSVTKTSDESLLLPLIDAVNKVCKTNITRRSTLNIYRVEMNRFVRRIPDADMS